MLNTKKFLLDYNDIEEDGGIIEITYEGLVEMLQEHHSKSKFVENGNTVHHSDGTVSIPPDYEGTEIINTVAI
jgi:hypothetical protein